MTDDQQHRTPTRVAPEASPAATSASTETSPAPSASPAASPPATSASTSAPRFTRLTARAVVLPDCDVDTDQIVPARFLKGTGKGGFADALFADWRARPGFPIGTPAAAGAQILVAGHNFGCGSSREHAAWALIAGGFRAVVSTAFADIFRGNALKNGLVPVVVSPAVHAALVAALAADPPLELTVDLEAQEVGAPGVTTTAFAVDPFARRCLLDGVDELGFLLRHLPDIEAHERRQDAGTASPHLQPRRAPHTETLA